MSKNNHIQQELQRGQEKAANRDSFIAQNYWLWVVIAFIGYPLASLLSALTEGGHVYMRLDATGAPFFLTIGLTLIISSLIEIFSYFTGKGAVDDVQAGVFSKSGAAKAAFFVKVIAFISITAFSIYVSISGSALINEKLRSHYTPPSASYVSTDSIGAYYDAKIALIRTDIEVAKTRTWRGKLTKDGSASIETSKEQIRELEAERKSEIATAKADNAKTKTDWEAETATNSDYAMGFAGLGEVIKLFCLIFIGIYDQGLSEEAAKFGGKKQGNQGSNINNQAQSSSMMFGQNAYQQNTPQMQQGRVVVKGFTNRGSNCKTKSVATGSYHSKNDENEIDEEVQAKTYKAAYAKAKGLRDSWRGKNPKGEEAKKTKANHIKNYEEEMDYYETELYKLGYQVELVAGCFKLVMVD